MNTNNTLTYLLYGILAVLIASAGYKACEMKKIQQKTAVEQQELNRTLSDKGFVEDDSTGQSSFVDDNSPPPPSTTDNNGIEYDEEPVRETVKEQSKPEQPVASTTKTKETTSAQTTYAAASSSLSDLRDLDNDTRKYRYRVVAGSFSKLDGARRRLEEVIQHGYQDAEIGSIRNGSLAQVVVVRTNNLAEANKVRDALKAKKIDAGLVDREK
ncbi:MAG: SPOR domain-containing protein [Saprospiraceae bacterium]|nr:SPOR domain-containing protein [Saprospiraceae bacterium]